MSTNLSPTAIIAQQLIAERVQAAEQRAAVRSARRAARDARREARRTARPEPYDAPMPAFRFLHPVR